MGSSLVDFGQDVTCQYGEEEWGGGEDGEERGRRGSEGGECEVADAGDYGAAAEPAEPVVLGDGGGSDAVRGVVQFLCQPVLVLRTVRHRQLVWLGHAGRVYVV